MTTINKTYKTFYFDLLEQGFNYMQARYIFSQAAFETANFTSNLFQKNNNLFGMKHPAIRSTTSLGEKNGFAYYNSVIDSIKDFQLYYHAGKYLTSYSSIDKYIEALKKRSYFEANPEKYSAGVQYYYDLYFST